MRATRKLQRQYRRHLRNLGRRRIREWAADHPHIWRGLAIFKRLRRAIALTTY